MDEQERKIMFRKTFDTVAEGYDNASLRFFPESARHLASCLDLKGDEHVLDVSTGTGCAALTLAASLPQGRVTGIDFSRGMLERANAKKVSGNINNVDFVEMDMQALEFPADHFDAAVCAFGIFFVDDMVGALRHIAEKVKTGGSIAVTTFHESTFSPLVNKFLDRLQQYGLEIPPMTWKRVAKDDGCIRLFEEAGLKNISCTGKDIGYQLENADQWWDLLWNGGYRGLINQLSDDDREKFKKEHLDEIAELSTGNGIWLEVNVLYTVGTIK